MFAKILVANRGEIACRVMRTARRMGIATVAVYCDSDQEALHVEMADEAVNIGPPPAAKSYLLIDRTVDAARRTGADAVHPGYGFLSERAQFAEALAMAGIAFIGPNAKAIAAMGDKIESKKLAAAARVSTVPGHRGVIENDAEAIAVACEIGMPVMIKASAGGGGKGMRIARSEDELAEGVRAARSEARASFGDDRVFIERYVESPRHIEIQVLGDRHGNIVHLGERECSIQRRNQKIVEEAPSPAVDAALREKMGAEAVALARAVGYDSAGTVEFIMGQDRSFYFLEMNTRLQVEHPVTEFVTGLDLVEQMIRVAAGEPLAFTQKDVRLDGWAVETRLCAEDPRRNFMPSIGRLTRYRPPAEGRDGVATLRIDAGVEEDSEISIYFDPLMAKVVTHGPDRAEAVEAMARALDRFVIDGVAHNAGLLSAIMASPRWQEGRLSSGFLDEEFPGGFSASPRDAETMGRLARVALAIELRQRAKFKTMRGRLNGEGNAWRANWVVAVGGTRLALRASPLSGAPFAVGIAADDGEPVTVASSWAPGDVLWSGTVGEEAALVQVRPVTGGRLLSSGGAEVSVRVMTPRVAALDALMSAKRPAETFRQLRCPMPGVVLEIAAAPGQEVRAGEALAVVEAMKMQNVLRAERDAKVKRVAVKAGDTLGVDAVIMEFE
ncbi:acetyl/propionyl/methylcrotonyl-CoA carboxylase subunit alpha [soil metagenome]